MLRIARQRSTAHPRSAGRATPAKRSLLVLLIALGLVLLQGPVLLHLLLVPHIACEHGELVEVATPAALAPGSHAAELRDPPSAQPRIKAGLRSGHEHCDALALRHRGAEVAPAVACASLQWIAPVVVSGERAATRSVPLLSLAPKGSPPAGRARSDRA